MGHSAQLYDGKIVIFGGWNGFKVLDDVVFIDLKNGIQNLYFNCPAVKGEPPRRQFHTANIIADNMYVFGGGDAKYWLNDLDMLNLRKPSSKLQARCSGPNARQKAPRRPDGCSTQLSRMARKSSYLAASPTARISSTICSSWKLVNSILMISLVTLTWS